MTFSACSSGKVATKSAGRIAKYLATSLAMLNVVRAPRVMRSCLPISTTSISFVGFESRSTMLPASLAAMVPLFMATPTSAWARAGASLVPSPVMATSFPRPCSLRISASLASGVASAKKSSTPASAAMALAVKGLSPVIMTVLMPIARSRSKRSRMPPLTTSLRCTTPSARPSSATTSGVAPSLAMRSMSRVSSAGSESPAATGVIGEAGLRDPARSWRKRRIAAPAPFAEAPGSGGGGEVHAAHRGSAR